MIKKILFIILLVILSVLSLALYNQYSMLPDRTVEEMDQAEQDAGALDKTWAPPKPSPAPEPQPPATQDLALWTEQGGQESLQAPPAGQSPPATQPEPAQNTQSEQQAGPAKLAAKPQTQETMHTDQAQAPGSQAPEQFAFPAEPAAQQEAAAGQQSEQQLSEKSAQDSPQPQDTPATLPVPGSSSDKEAASKAEKALMSGKSWFEQQGRDFEHIMEKGEEELQHEQEIVDKMRLTRKEETSPEAEVNKLVKKLEEKSLGLENPQPPTPPQTAEAPQKPAAPAPAAPKASDRNQLTSLQLSSDGEAVMLRVVTSKPVAGKSSFKMHKPKRFVLDLHGLFLRSVPRVDVLPNAMVKDLRTGLHPDKLRIVADLHDDIKTQIAVETLSPTELLVILRQQQ